MNGELSEFTPTPWRARLLYAATLRRYGLENALSNARKYGAGGDVEFALEYDEPMLTVQVTNAADPEAQATLIAKYGPDATGLLRRRVEGGGSQSTNLGGQALLDVARLLSGRVEMLLAPEASIRHVAGDVNL